MTDTEKVLRATIRELERLNTELNNELGSAVQVLKLERDSLRGRLAAVLAVAGNHMTGPISGIVMDWVPLDDLRAALTEPTPSELPATSNFEVAEGDPRPDIEELIDRSSFGAPEAKAARASVSDEVAARVVARSKELRADAPPSSEPQSESKLGAPGPDPEGGVDLTDEEFAAFLKAAKS